MINYTIPPKPKSTITTTLSSPIHNSKIKTQDIEFSCSATINQDTFESISLYANFDGNFKKIETYSCPISVIESNTILTGFSIVNGNCQKSLNSDSITAKFKEKVNPGTYIWNCKSCTKNNGCNFAQTNYTLIREEEILTQSIFAEFIEPTPEDYSIQSENNIFINVSISSQIKSCILEWNNKNEVMNKVQLKDKTICFSKKSSLEDGEYNYKVILEDLKSQTEELVRSLIISNEDFSDVIEEQTSCGDGICSQDENSNNCELDCPSIELNTCEENWECVDWSNCLEDKKTRTCEDLAQCDTEDKKPAEEIKCRGPGGKSFEVNLEIPRIYQTIYSDESLESKVIIKNYNDEPTNVNLNYLIKDENNKIIRDETEEVKVEKNSIVSKWIKSPDREGEYTLNVKLEYGTIEENSEISFEVVKDILLRPRSSLTLPLLLIITFILIGLFVGIRILIKNRGDKKNEK